jgi:hypothetical protein
MSKNIITKIFVSILVFVILASSVSAALPIDPNSIAVKIDDQTVTSGSTTRLNIEREQAFEVQVVLASTDVVSNVEIQAFVSGYEHNDVERVFASTPLFDMAANVSYTKRLTLRLPSDASADNYKLRLVISDRNNDAIVKNYDLRLDAPRHLLRVDDVNVFSGGNSNQVTSGDPLLVNVRVKNLGERNEEDIKVKVSVPELGLVGTKYIDTIRTDKSEETGSIYMKLPKCAEPGVYPVAVDVSYNNHKSTLSDKSQAITVLKNTACDKPAEKIVVVEVQQPPQTPAPAVTQVQESTDNSENTIAKVRSILEIFLVVLFAIFIVIGIVVFFSRLLRNPDEDED